MKNLKSKTTGILRQKFTLALICILLSGHVFSQDDLMDLLNKSNVDDGRKDYVSATFKSTRIINGQSVETPSGGVLLFLISHRFGPVNGGAYEFFGLDQATIRLGLEYGITDRIAIGVGRSSMDKTFDGFGKYKLLKQAKKGKPVSIDLFSSIALNSLRFANPDRENFFSSRLAFTNQILIARKFNDSFSFQLTPTLVHINLVPDSTFKNDVIAIGAGMRHKLTKRISINAEYFYVLPDQQPKDYSYNSASLGFDIETGGHVFQLHFTNSKGMIERFFIPETKERWSKGGIHFGFNISRVFTLDRKK